MFSDGEVAVSSKRLETLEYAAGANGWVKSLALIFLSAECIERVV